jgi:hypothetical protein
MGLDYKASYHPGQTAMRTRKASAGHALVVATPEQQRKASRLLDILDQRVARTGWHPFEPEKPHS